MNTRTKHILLSTILFLPLTTPLCIAMESVEQNILNDKISLINITVHPPSSRLLEVPMTLSSRSLESFPSYIKTGKIRINEPLQERNKTIFSCVKINNEMFNHVISEIGVDFQPDTKRFSGGYILNMLDAKKASTEPVSSFYAPSDIFVKTEKLSFENDHFNVNGNMTFQINEIIVKKCYMWPVGNLVFKSLDTDCPIHKIKIVICDSQKPILIDGSLNFSSSPFIDIECLNAAWIEVKYRRISPVTISPMATKESQGWWKYFLG